MAHCSLQFRGLWSPGEGRTILHYVNQRQQQHFWVKSHQRHLPDRWSFCLFCYVIWHYWIRFTKHWIPVYYLYQWKCSLHCCRSNPSLCSAWQRFVPNTQNRQQQRKLFPLAKNGQPVWAAFKIQMPAGRSLQSKGILCYQQRSVCFRQGSSLWKNWTRHTFCI